MALFCFFSIEKTLFSPLKRAFFVFFFCVSLSFSLAFFGLPPFHFLFLCLSLFLFFLSSCLSFLLSFCFLFLSLFFRFLSSLLLFHEKNNIKMFQLQSFCSSIRSHFCWFPLFFFLSNSLTLSLFFLILSFVFVQHQFFLWEMQVQKKSNKKGMQQNGFFYQPVFSKMWRVIVLGIFAIFLDFQKNTVKRYFSTFFKAENYKRWHFWKLLSGPSWKLLSGPSWKLLSGPSWCVLKNTNLDQINNFQMLLRAIFQNCAETTILKCIFAIGVLKKTNLDQIITSKTPKLGPDNKSTTNIYIYMCIYMFREQRTKNTQATYKIVEK